MAINKIILDPSAVARALGAVAVLLVLASIAGQLTKYLTGHDQVYGLVRLFYVDEEQNIPTLFSVFLLSFAALLLTVITVFKKRDRAPDVSGWAVLSAGFMCMAVDESWSFHERLVTPVRKLLGDDALGIFYFAWVVPGIVVVLGLALFFLGFLRRLPPRTAFLFVVSGALFVGGAVGFELIGGYYAKANGAENLTYSMIATVEESLEMSGVIVFIYALLKYIADNCREVRFGFDESERDPRASDR
jgi:hypothetical protein